MTRPRPRRPSLPATIAATLALTACVGELYGGPGPLVVRIAPSRGVYAVGDTVRPSAERVDGSGRAVGTVEVEWTAEPADAVRVEGDRLRLLRAGTVHVRGCLPPVPADGSESPRCDTARLLVDDGPPVLEVTEPLPGAELGGGDAAGEMIQVRGQVHDRRMTRVFVDGTPASLDAEGRFEAAVRGVPGIQHIEVVASDGVSEEVRSELDVLFAPAYLAAPAAEEPGLVLDDGIRLRVGQAALDDGRAVGLDLRPVATDDVADVLSVVLASVDRSLLPPDPVVNSDGLVLAVASLRAHEVATELNAADGTLEAFVRVGELRMETAGWFRNAGIDLPLEGEIVVSLAAFTRLRIEHRAGAPVTVEMDPPNVAVEDATGRFVDPDTDALFALASSALRQRLEEDARTILTDALARTMPVAVSQILDAADTALQGHRLPIEMDGLAPRVVHVDGRLAELSSRWRDGLDAHLRLALSVETPEVIHPGSRGVPLVGGELGPAPLRDSAQLQVAVRLAALNGLLHSLWRSGMLRIDLARLAGGALSGLVSEGRVDGRLPPVVRAARPGEAGDLVLSVGQLELETRVDGATTVLGIAIDVPLRVHVDGDQLAIEPEGEPRLRVWPILTPNRSPIDLESLVPELVLGTLWPEVREALIRALRFDLPVPRTLDGLPEIAPGLARLRLAISLDRDIEIQRGHLVLTGRLSGVLP